MRLLCEERPNKLKVTCKSFPFEGDKLKDLPCKKCGYWKLKEPACWCVSIFLHCNLLQQREAVAAPAELVLPGAEGVFCAMWAAQQSWISAEGVSAHQVPQG